MKYIAQLLVGSCHIQYSTEPRRTSGEPILLHFPKEQIVLIGKMLIVPPNLPNNAMFTSTIRALRSMVCETSKCVFGRCKSR
jgi:hypothetical protein